MPLAVLAVRADIQAPHASVWLTATDVAALRDDIDVPLQTAHSELLAVRSAVRGPRRQRENHRLGLGGADVAWSVIVS